MPICTSLALNLLPYNLLPQLLDKAAQRDKPPASSSRKASPPPHAAAPTDLLHDSSASASGLDTHMQVSAGGTREEGSGVRKVSLAEAIWRAFRVFKDSLSLAARPKPQLEPAASQANKHAHADRQAEAAGEREEEAAAAVGAGYRRRGSLGSLGGRRQDERGAGNKARDLRAYGMAASSGMLDAHARSWASDAMGAQPLWTATKVEEAEEVLQWHCANLEFALGAPLELVSADWWNFDDACAFSGPHWVLPGGYASLLAPLQVSVAAELGRAALLLLALSLIPNPSPSPNLKIIVIIIITIIITMI